MNTTIEFSIFELVLAQSFTLTGQFIFGPNLPKKGVCTSKEKNRVHNIPISLIPNFISSQQLWFFGPNLSQKISSAQNTTTE